MTKPFVLSWSKHEWHSDAPFDKQGERSQPKKRASGLEEIFERNVFSIMSPLVILFFLYRRFAGKSAF
jgi:hypothetical protein